MRTRLPIVALSLLLGSHAVHGFDVQGHRGARGLAPENTLAAFERAIALGVTTIETDVGISRDDVPVLAHDRVLNPVLTRDAGGRWLSAPGPAIRSLALAELKAYDVGRVNPSSAYGRQWTTQAPVDGERIPALAELFELVRSRDARVNFNLETKLSPFAPDETADAVTFARLVVQAVEAAGVSERTTIQSFDWRTLREVKRLAPAIRTACLTQEGGSHDTVRANASGRSPWHGGLSLAQAGGSLPRLVREAQCDIWSPFWRNATPERIREAQALGLAVIPWTVNDIADMRVLMQAGVDGLITDYPDRLLALRKESQRE